MQTKANAGHEVRWENSHYNIIRPFKKADMSIIRRNVSLTGRWHGGICKF
jgi:hypothetical protein